MAYINRGWAVIPVNSIKNGKCTCGKADCASPGKHPKISNWQHEASIDPEQIKKWFSNNDTNIGILTGQQSNLIVLDIDNKNENIGDASFDELFPDGIDTVEAITGNGRHLYFKYSAGKEIGNSIGLMPGLDLKGNGGFVVAPPSVHSSGRQYAFEASSLPANTPLAELPNEILEKIKRNSATPRNVSKPNEKVGEGQRNDYLFSQACSMQRRGMSYPAIVTALKVENKNKCDPALSDSEIETIAQSSQKYPPEEPNQDYEQGPAKDYHYTDLGNAERLIDRNGTKLIYCGKWKRWLYYDGRK